MPPSSNPDPKEESKNGSPESEDVTKASAVSSKDSSNKDVNEENAHPSITKPPATGQESAAKKDLMISYSHVDNAMMLRVRDKLEQNGIRVWVDVSGLQAGVDFLSKIGEAIIEAKLFVSLLSKSCVKSRYCQDELALAYVSDSAIYPVAIEDPADIRSEMNTGMKLQLARYEWTVIGKHDFDEKFDTLIEDMKKELKRRSETGEKEQVSKEKVEQQEKFRHNLNRKRESKTGERTDVQEIMVEKFWKDNFKSADCVPFEDFQQAFTKQFHEELGEFFSEEDQRWLMSILRRELEVEDDNKLYKHMFMDFCSAEGMPRSVWSSVFEKAQESYAMKEVFDMESSVRVEAIENLGKFRSAAVIDALRDLLTDEDANVRAVAAVSLARTEANDPVTVKFLSKTLKDKDRLVREAGCLALGHLQAKQVVSKLLHLWRNDVISHVREAARVALEQIGGPEVEKAMHVTKVLADEIRQLTGAKNS